MNRKILKVKKILCYYLYVTSGIKDDESKGKDVRAGYSLEKIGTGSSVKFGSNTIMAQLYYFKKGQVNKAFVIKVWDNDKNYS